MPKKGSRGEYAPLPRTLRKSPKKAQETYEETLESAEKSYDGNQERSHRAAWASVKHSFEKVGDRWEPKSKRGPSDERARQGGRHRKGKSHGGVDVEGKTKDELIDEARKRGVHVTTHMRKGEIATALSKANRKETRAHEPSSRRRR